MPALAGALYTNPPFGHLWVGGMVEVGAAALVLAKEDVAADGVVVVVCHTESLQYLSLSTSSSQVYLPCSSWLSHTP